MLARPTPRALVGRLLGSRLIRVAFLLAVLALGVAAVAGQWGQLGGALDRLPAWAPLAAFAGILVGAGGTLLSWRAVLAGLGSPLPVRAAGRVYFVGQLGKYLPGSVWPAVAQAELGRGHGVPGRRSAGAFALSVLISLAAALFLAAAVLPLLAGPTTRPYRALFLLAPALLCCLHPRVFRTALAWLARLTGRPAPERRLGARAVAAAFGWSLLSWLGFGAQVWTLAAALGAPAARSALLAVGGFAFAWSAGFLVVLAPAGAGVREAALVAALAPALRPGAALLVALCSRLLMTVGDFGCAAVAAVLARSAARLDPASAPAEGRADG